MASPDEEPTNRSITTPDNSKTIFAQKLKEYLLTKGGGSDRGSSYYVVGKITSTGVSLHEGVSREEAAQILDEPLSMKRKVFMDQWKQKTLTKFEGVSIIVKSFIKALKGY